MNRHLGLSDNYLHFHWVLDLYLNTHSRCAEYRLRNAITRLYFGSRWQIHSQRQSGRNRPLLRIGAVRTILLPIPESATLLLQIVVQVSHHIHPGPIPKRTFQQFVFLKGSQTVEQRGCREIDWYLYQKHGVRQYWIVNPQSAKVIAYYFDTNNSALTHLQIRFRFLRFIRGKVSIVSKNFRSQ